MTVGWGAQGDILGIDALSKGSRKWISRSSLALALALTAGCAANVSTPPTTLKLDPFYRQYVDAHGIPVVGSAKVPPAAIRRARDIIDQMLAHRPDILAALVSSGARVAIMAQDEGTMDLPEQRDWKKPTINDPVLTFCERKLYDQRIGRLSDRDYWNNRARGMGGVLTSGAAENILAVPGTRYYGENIFVHEFSHEILDGVRQADPALFARVKAAYAAMKSRHMWKGEYIETTYDEYWAEGTQFWFNSNRVAVIDGRVILSDADLKAYDPTLYELLGEVYGQRHRLRGDAFYKSPARVPPGGLPASTAEVC